MPPQGSLGPRGFLTDEEKANMPKVTGALLKRILGYLKPYWLQFILVFVTILISVFQIVTHKYTVGMDSYVITRVRLTVEGDRNFRPVLDEKIKAWKAHPTSFSVSEGKDGQQHYDMYLMAPQTITTEELMEFSNTHPEIKFISGEMQIG